MKVFAVALAAVALPALSDAQNVLLRYKFSPGQVYRQKMTMAMNMKYSSEGTGMNMPPMNFVTTSTQRVKVLSVAKDGTGTLSMVIDSMAITMNGKPAPSQPIPKPSTVKISPMGQVSSFNLGTKSAGGMNMGFLQNMQTVSALPSSPVHVGSRWQSSASLGGGKSMTMNCTLAKLTKRGNSQLAHIRTTGVVDPSMFASMLAGGPASGMKMAGTVKFDYTYVLNLGKGYIDNQSGGATFDMSMTMPRQNSKPMTIHMRGTQTMSLQSLS